MLFIGSNFRVYKETTLFYYRNLVENPVPSKYSKMYENENTIFLQNLSKQILNKTSKSVETNFIILIVTQDLHYS